MQNLTAALLQLPNLQVLNTSYSLLGGSSLPAAWSGLQQLQVLDISRSNMWNSPPRMLPAQWCNMTSLRVLKAEQTGLGGTLDALPVSRPCMPSLQVLQLGGNRDLGGTLPPGKLWQNSRTLIALAELCVLHIACSAQSNATFLQCLTDKSVNLTACMHAGWASTPFRLVDLNSTQVSGSLPQEWASNATANTTVLGSSLQELYLHQTQLQGEIPESWWTAFPNFTRFTVWSTRVCGRHPLGSAGLGALCLDTAGTKLGELLLLRPQSAQAKCWQTALARLHMLAV